MGVSTDQYNEVTNSTETYEGIADRLAQFEPVVIGWTDGAGSHLDLLFALGVSKLGNLQCGLRPSGDLFVGVMRRGCFGFDATTTDTDPGYFAEKLGMAEYAASFTLAALAELINGIRANLKGWNEE